MSETIKCPKCGGEMREGEIYVDVKTLSGGLGVEGTMGRFGSMGPPGGMGALGTTVSVKGPLWREYTGKEKGWLIKEKERKTLSIGGKRCLECCYVELYVEKK